MPLLGSSCRDSAELFHCRALRLAAMPLLCSALISLSPLRIIALPLLNIALGPVLCLCRSNHCFAVAIQFFADAPLRCGEASLGFSLAMLRLSPANLRRTYPCHLLGRADVPPCSAVAVLAFAVPCYACCFALLRPASAIALPCYRQLCLCSARPCLVRISFALPTAWRCIDHA